ncbi:MAG: valine--tRNA ligase [bacterium]|nr:valine--tRNA ligase [bacterium]
MFNKPYNPKEVEDGIYELWEKSGFFNPDNLPISKTKNLKPKTFSIIMPPPNANGSLHFGHALFIALEDLMIRYQRMRGKKTLWLPGADHAGFETQVVFDKKLEKEGRNRFQISRDELYREMMEFTLSNKKVMENQLRKLGASCDWSREKFTLDPDIISKTQDTFIDLHKKGLVYRGERLVNWCIKHQTSLSDIETDSVEKKDSLYYIKYGPLTVATVRPETIFGDTAVAVNPKDKRYKNLIGKEIEVDVVIGKLKLKVIADDFVDPKFGTGAVKVTPAHDPNDFEIWQRHKNEIEGPREVINQFGKMSVKAKEFEGLKISEARKLIVEKLKEKGLIEKIDESYNHAVAVCYKCQNILEPRLLPQWFVKIEPLAKPAIQAVKSGKIKFVPKRFEKVFFHWMKNIRDWNISRQIIWGIRIPAWFCECGEIIVQKEKPKKCAKCSGNKIKQDPDVFDTWFSSGQWPYLALGYPNSKDYKTFYPTDVMETGWDILFFWVARMIMLGIYRTGKIPFRYVYLHGLVRDKDRQKMSKSKGNVIDPLGVAGIYGADAVRMSLITSAAAGNDPVISEDKIRGYRNFATKIWNISRFVLMNYDSKFEKIKPKFTKEDRKNLKNLKTIHKKITKDIENFKFHIAAHNIYHYIWHTFADKILENSKPRLRSENIIERATAFKVNFEILFVSLKLLHPFMPFITEEIYQNLPIKNKKLLMIEKW